MDDTNRLLTQLLAAGEGGNPPITIFYDDAAFTYGVTQRKHLNANSDTWRGYGRSPLAAILDLIEGQVRTLNAQR